MADHTYSVVMSKFPGLGTEASTSSITNLGNNYVLIFYFS